MFSKVAESTDFPLCTEQEFPLLLIFLELKISNLFQFHRSQMVFALVFNFHFLAVSNSVGYHLPPRLLLWHVCSRQGPTGGLLLLSQLLFSILSFSFWPSITLSLKCSFDKCKFVIIILPRFQFFPLWNFISTLSLVFVPLVLLLIFDWPIHLQWNVWNEMGVQLLFFLSLTDAPLSIISQLLQTIYANSCVSMSH